MRSRAEIIIASAGSTLFGARAAAAAFSKPMAALNVGAAPDSVSIFTDHGHLLLERALDRTLDADILMLPTEMIDRLRAAERLAAVGPVDLGAVNIGAAVSARTAAVKVADTPALVQALRDAREIILTLAPTGEHMMNVITGLGLLPVVENKIRRFDKSVEVNAHLVEAAEGALAFGPATEILSWRDRGLTWCGAIPAALQLVLPYSAAISQDAKDERAARTFLTFLASEVARNCFTVSGVEFNS